MKRPHSVSLLRILWLVAACASLSLTQTHAAQPLDLTNGLGKLNWGISREEAWQRAAGQGNTLKKSKEYHAGYEEDAIVATKGNVITTYSFIQGHLFAFTRVISSPLGGYFTKEDLDAANLGEQAKQLFKANSDITLEAGYNTPGRMDDRVTNVDVWVKATNQRVYNEVMDKMRAENPNLSELLIKPLGER